MNWRQRYQDLVDPLRTERWVELAVVGLLALLLLQLLWGAYRAVFPSMPEPVQPTAEALKIGELRAREDVPPELRAEIRQRPLFWSTRRPLGSVEQGELAAAEAAEAAAQGKPGKIEGVKLAGIFGSGESAGIIVIAQGKKHRIRVDQEINGWTLQSVAPTEALFSSNGREARLALQRGKIVVTGPEPGNEPSVEGKSDAPESADDAGKGGKAKKTNKNPKNKPEPVSKANEGGLTLGGRASKKN